MSQDLARVGVIESPAKDLGNPTGKLEHVQAAVLGLRSGQSCNGQIGISNGLDFVHSQILCHTVHHSVGVAHELNQLISTGGVKCAMLHSGSEEEGMLVEC